MPKTSLYLSSLSGRIGIGAAIAATLCFFTLRSPPVPAKKGAESLNFDPLGLPTKRIPSSTKKIWGQYKRVSAIASTFETCKSRGGSDEECLATAVFCDLQGQALSSYMTRYGSLVSWGVGQLQIFDAFKTTACGADCYWCCLTPTGCHSSFGPSPVINCNGNYGAGSHTIGKTLIVADNGIKACLGVPQTCDHYAQCRYSSEKAWGMNFPGSKPENTPNLFMPPPVHGYGWTSPSSGWTCNVDPAWMPKNGNDSLEPKNMSMAINAWVMEQKLRALGESVVRKTSAFIERIPADFPREGEFYDLLSFRGCKGAHKLAEMEPFDGTFQTFLTKATKPEVQADTSRRRALMFLASLRVLSGIPNFRERFIYVESRLWTCKAREDYLKAAGVTDADAVLAKTMGPAALRILKTVDGLQDYRLLAVPVPGEKPAMPMVDGCPMAPPPEVSMALLPMVGNKFQVGLLIKDPDDTPPALANYPVSIDWGDGTLSSHEGVLGGAEGGKNTFGHTYAEPGRYRILAIVSGKSGLRGMEGRIVNVGAGDPMAKKGPSYLRASFPNLRTYSESAGEVGTVFMGLRHALAGTNMEEVVGQSGYEGVTNNAYTAMGDLVAYNDERSEVSKLVLRPQRAGGRLFDLRKVFWVLSDLVLEVPSLDDGELIKKTIRLDKSMLRVYYKDRPDMAIAAAVVPEMGGMALRVPLIVPGATSGSDPMKELDRIEVDLPGLLSGIDPQRPQFPEDAVGAYKRFSEVAPGKVLAGELLGVKVDLPLNPDGGPDGGGMPTGCSCRIGGRR